MIDSPKIYFIKYLAYFLILLSIFSVGYRVGYTSSSEKCAISSANMKKNHKEEIEKISKERDNQLLEAISSRDKSKDIFISESNRISQSIKEIHKNEVELKEKVNNEENNINNINCFDDASLQLLKEGYGY